MNHKTALENLANAEREANRITVDTMRTVKICAIATTVIVSVSVASILGLYATTKVLPTAFAPAIAKIEMTPEMKACMETSTNPFLVGLREAQEHDISAKVALQQTCHQLVEAAKVK